MMNRAKYIIIIFNKSNYCRKLAPARILTQDSLHERRRPFIKETAASCMVALAAGQGGEQVNIPGRLRERRKAARARGGEMLSSEGGAGGD
jgi:hypothetical protein